MRKFLVIFAMFLLILVVSCKPATKLEQQGTLEKIQETGNQVSVEQQEVNKEAENVINTIDQELNVDEEVEIGELI